MSDVIKEFESIYKESPAYTAFTPYRICPLGAHIDHQLGIITGFTIDKGIHLAYAPRQNGVVELKSLQFEKRCQFHVNAVPETKQNDWADYLRGAAIALGKKYPLHIGMYGVINGELPIGGLSSSAAVIITFLTALCHLNSLHITAKEMIQTARCAENSYVGVSCGKLDQSCEVYCRKDHLLYMDMLDDHTELIPKSSDMKPYRIAVIFSGVERSLAGSGYNTRVDECRAAAYALKAFAGLEYGKLSETVLREVPYEVYLRYKDLLPENWRKRTEHYYSEFDRARRGAEAWRRGDLAEFGRLIFESGRSSIDSWETGSPELKTLYEIMTHTDGIYGGRFSGAGFNGCCMALTDPAFTDDITKQITEEYLRIFPERKDKFAVYFCSSSDGVHLD